MNQSAISCLGPKPKPSFGDVPEDSPGWRSANSGDGNQNTPAFAAEPLESAPVLAPEQIPAPDARADACNVLFGIEDIESDLPKPLGVLFGLNGASMSLQSLAIMYMLNSHVEVPVPYLPTYGAVAFLPWSLKPIYASFMALIPSFPRAWLISSLLGLNAMCIAGTALLPSHAIVACFALAFATNLFAAWAEFCLGVTLIDRARIMDDATNSFTSSPCSCDPAPALSPTASALISSSSLSVFDTLVAKFQSQAATGRNVGSLTANACTLVILAHAQWAYSDAGISYVVAVELFLLASGLNLLGATFVFCNADEFVSRATADHILVPTIDDMEDPEDQPVQECRRQSNQPNQHTCQEQKTRSDLSHERSVSVINTEDGLCDAFVVADESLRLSYDNDEERDSRLSHTNNGNTEQIGSSVSSCVYVGMETQMIRSKTRLFSAGNMVLIGLLQLAIITIAMRQPIVGISSDLVWRTVIFTCMLAFAATAIAMYLQVPALSSGDWMTHRTGIFLMLRHAMPSDSMIVSSFFYSILSSTPIVYQLVTMADTAASTIGSWTYGKFLSKYSNGLPLQRVIIGTTVLCIMASFGMVCLVRVTNGHSNASLSAWVVSAVFIAHFSSTLASEWAFLPDVVIATTASKPSDSACGQSHHLNGELPNPALSHDDHDEIERMQIDDVKKESSASAATAMKYGTMVSCIGFGDQLGAMLGGPLAAVLQVSRERGWYHLDWLIAISAVLNLLPLLCLWLLPNKKPQS